METTYIGIDPGLSGAIAFVDSEFITIYDTPTMTIGGNHKNIRGYNIPAIIQLLKDNVADLKTAKAALEIQHAFPGQGVRSMFTCGEGYGMWKAILSTLQISFELVSAVRWKKSLMADMLKDKDASRLKAMQLFPSQDFSKKCSHNRAEALLIAEYLRRL